MAEGNDSTDMSIKAIIKGGENLKKTKTVVDGQMEDIKSPLLEYKMTHKDRGMCLLINQKHFDPSTGQNTRNGTNADADRVEVVFRKLGFKVERHTDLTRRQILEVLLSASKADHSEMDCFTLIILSHGNGNVIYSTDGTVPVENITRYFCGDRCPSLVGKPKMFFFQACRGQKFDMGVEMTDSLVRTAAGDISTKLPIQADFLLAFSTVPGYFSWRNSEDGSWFIQSLCKVLKEHAPQGVEMMHMMLLVNRLVATSYESCTDAEWSDGMKQMPSIDCRLTKLLYFNRKAT